MPWTYVISDINAKEIVRTFHELQKASLTLEKNSRVEKFIKKMSNGKAMIIHLLTGLIRKMWLYKMSQYFPRSYQRFDGGVNVE